jgi:hypothetical protein
MKKFPIALALSALAAIAATGAIASAAGTPAAADDTATVTSGSVTSIDVLSNDTLTTGQGWVGSSLTIMSQPDNGWAGTDPINNLVTYTAPDDWAGTTSFTYQVCDTSGGCATATVNVTVNAPVPFVSPYSGLALTPGTINLPTEGEVFTGM